MKLVRRATPKQTTSAGSKGFTEAVQRSLDEASRIYEPAARTTTEPPPETRPG